MSKASVKLNAKWQLDAALLSRPVDLTPLVAMSRSHPDNFLEDNSLHRLVTLLNDANENKSNKVIQTLIARTILPPIHLLVIFL